MDQTDPGATRFGAITSVLALVWVAWLSDIGMAWLTGYRWGQSYFLLPSAGSLLALGFLVSIAACLMTRRGRTAFRVASTVLILAGSALLWLQRLAWTPSQHRIPWWAWWGITAILAISPFLVARLPARYLVSATPLLIFAYHTVRFAATEVRLVHLGIFAGVATILLFSPRIRSSTVRGAFLAVSLVVAVAGCAVFTVWSTRSFIEETSLPNHRRTTSLLKKNIILIVIDTLRADRLGSYGYRVRATTPFLDEFASRSTVFRNAYASSTWTVPSVATMFTGLPPELHGVTAFGDKLPRNATLLAETLRNQGYYTVGVSTNPLIDVRSGFARGFDRFAFLTRLLTATGNGVSFWSDAIISLQRGSIEGWLPGAFVKWTVKPPASDAVDAAMERLDQVRDGSPVFLYVHLLDPHHPPTVLPDDSTANWHPAAEDRIFDADWSVKYDREIRYLDSQIKRLVNEIDHRLDPTRTVVAIVADHGEQLGEHSKRGHGANLDDVVLRVPLLVRTAPGPPAVVQEPFSLTRLPALLAQQPLPPELPVIRAHIIPPASPGTALRGIQLHGWKLIEYSTAANPRARFDRLFRLPDEESDRKIEHPGIAADLRARLAELPVGVAAAKYDPETAARLRSLGYLH